MATNIDQLIEVREIALKITQDAIDKLLILDEDADEDYADALDSVGTLFKYVGSKMIHDIYKDDPDASVRQHMQMVLGQAESDAEDALSSLRSFDIIAHQIINEGA